MDYIYELELQVRDYELDAQSVVNNGTYMNYMEHTRHEFLKAIGLNFVEMHNNGVDAMVIKAEMDFKFPLKADEEFVVRIDVQQKGALKIIFHQDIYRKSDNKLILKGLVTACCVNNQTGRPCAPLDMFEKINAYRETAKTVTV